MAKYKAYPEYKDSGVEWFDVRPLSWKVTRLKLETFMNMGQSPSSDDCNIEGDGLAFLQGNAEFGKVNPIEKQYCPVPKKIANPGDILFSVRAPVGAMNFADKKYGIGRGLCSIAASAKLTSPFLWWLLPTYKYQLDTIATGSTFEAVSAEQLGNLCFALPSISEQSQIAAFLDHETAKIDNLIEKQQQLIELLKEKRQTVISQAVTKGLNPDVPMKDSGVEWLGEVPEHWGVTTLRNLIRNQDVFIQDGNHGELHPVAAEYVDEGIPFLMANNVRGSKVDLVECKRISKSRADKLRIGFAKAGDMLLTHKGTVGEVASIPDYIPEPYWMLTPQVTYYRWNKNKYDSKFCAYLFQSKCIQIQLEIIGSKQSTRSYVGLIAQGELIVAVPPLAEQQAIRKRLDIRTSRLEEMLAFAEKNIELMQERRTALISAAVTGKIDVRDWVAPDTQDVKEPQEATA